jgi:hypothetical protein
MTRFAGIVFSSSALFAACPLWAQDTQASRPPNYAQFLTERALERHPDALVVAFHAVVPGETLNRVVAINNPKLLWKPSDDIDTDTAKTSRTVVQVIPATHRMEVHLPLHNRDGATIATFCVVYNFKDEHEAPEFFRRSQVIRDEIAPMIRDVPQLLESRPASGWTSGSPK